MKGRLAVKIIFKEIASPNLATESYTIEYNSMMLFSITWLTDVCWFVVSALLESVLLSLCLSCVCVCWEWVWRLETSFMLWCVLFCLYSGWRVEGPKWVGPRPFAEDLLFTQFYSDNSVNNIVRWLFKFCICLKWFVISSLANPSNCCLELLPSCL